MRLLTWNTQWCRGMDGVVDPARIVREARAFADFDVLCLQEISDNYPALGGDPRGDQVAQIAKALPGFHVVFGACIEEWNEEYGHQRFGNLIASRHPVRWFRQHPLLTPNIRTNTERLASMPRGCAEAMIELPNGALVRVMTTHLEYSSMSQRVLQTRALANIQAEAVAMSLPWSAPSSLDKDGTPYQRRPQSASAILCGDFNSLIDGFEMEPLVGPQGSYRDACALMGVQRVPTFHDEDEALGTPDVCIDHVLVSAEVVSALRHYAVDTNTRASDHQPVLVDIDDALLDAPQE